jgi:6-phosphogluconolactonase
MGIKEENQGGETGRVTVHRPARLGSLEKTQEGRSVTVNADVDIVLVSDPEALAREAAGRFTDLALEAVEGRGRFSAALSGGSTPGLLYRQLAEDPYRSQIPWKGVHLFWGDERCVPPSDHGSNYRLAEEAFISHVPLPPGNVHRVHGELEPAAAARAYERQLGEYFCGPRTRFDLVLLGLGSDGHTASLFPGSPTLDETERLVANVQAHYGDRPAHRVTLTLPAINSARAILFLVSGRDKAEITQAVLKGPTEHLPAQRVRPVAGQLTWLLDAGASHMLNP